MRLLKHFHKILMKSKNRPDQSDQLNQMDLLNGPNIDQYQAAAQQPTTVPSPNPPRRHKSRTLKLDTLPLEIIRQIASHTGCKAVVALQKACRVLHHACTDVFVMKQILDRCSIESSDSAQHSSLAWYSGALSLRTPFSSWARYALAHEEMERLIKDLEDEQAKGQLRQRRIASWLPQLLALHCQQTLTKAIE
jgi:hypothetical protein